MTNSSKEKLGVARALEWIGFHRHNIGSRWSSLELRQTVVSSGSVVIEGQFVVASAFGSNQL